jgi:type III secretory pathway component EscS
MNQDALNIGHQDERTKRQVFDKSFWQQFWLSLFTNLIMLIIAVVLGLFITGYMERATQLFETMNSTLINVQSTLEAVAGIDTVQLQEQAAGVAESATSIGEGVGDGGAEVINRAGEAWNNFLEGRETENEQ